MGKKGKKAQAGKPKKLTPKDIGKRLNALAKKLEEELKDFDLFAPLPPTDDCAICLEPLSRNMGRKTGQMCCGNQICRKCLHGQTRDIRKQNEKNSSKKTIVRTCPFCREPDSRDDEEMVKRVMARVSCNDPMAMFILGLFSIEGTHGFPKDEMTGYYHLIRAAELGSAQACTKLVLGHESGEDSEFFPLSKERQFLFLRVATARGDPAARYLLGATEYEMGDRQLGIRHWKIAAEAGYEDAFDDLKSLGREFITKDELDKICEAAGFQDQEGK